MRICTNCGTTNSESLKSCKYCGSALKSVNNVVVRTHYRRHRNSSQSNTIESSDFNPVQHLQKTTQPQNPPLQPITPKVNNLEYKFHSPLEVHNNHPLKSIPPTPVDKLVIPKPIQPKRTNINSGSNRDSERPNPVILSDNTITNNDLKEIPHHLPSNQPSVIQPVRVPRVGESLQQNVTNPNPPNHPIMSFSSQSLQSQQIEQEMAEVMNSLRVPSDPRPVSKSEPQVTTQSDSIPNSLEDILINLSQLDLNIEASALVNMDGNIIASAVSERIDEFLISTITNTLGTISQDVIASLESGDLKFISIFATKGILFLSPIMKNVFLVLYTTSDAKIGLINLARMVVKKKIELFYAKQNLRKSPI